jgi:type II secretory pathway pseudopilin PulG
MRGVTLIELGMVLLILVALAGLLVPYAQNSGGIAECVATDASLVAIRDAIMGSGAQSGYLSDTGTFPRHPGVVPANVNPYSLHYLFNDWNGNAELSSNSCMSEPTASDCTHLPHFNPTTQRGWRGPYLSNSSNCGSLPKQYAAPCPPKLSPLFAVCKIGLPDQYAECGSGSCAGECNACGLCQTNAGSSSNYVHGGLGVALDAYPLMGPTGMQPVRTPIQLFSDSQGHHYLVSAGRDSVTYLSNGVDPSANLRGDDRVLYLDSNDPWGNKPCQ